MPSAARSRPHSTLEGQGYQSQSPKTQILPPLPEAVKREIVSCLPVADAKNLALADREWKAAAESYLWALIRVLPVDEGPQTTSIPGPIKSRQAYETIRQHLGRHPARVPLIKRLELRTWPGASADFSVIIRGVAPTLEVLEERGNCTDHSGSESCDVADVIHRIFARQPFPRLKALETDFDRNWPESLPGVLRMMPNLEDLSLRGGSDGEDLVGPSVVWPTLDSLSRLSISGNFGSMNVATTLLPLCPSLRKLDLLFGQKAAMETDEIDQAAAASLMTAVLNCTTLNSLYICIDMEYLPAFHPHHLGTHLDGRLPDLKRLQMGTEIVHPYCVPSHSNLQALELDWPGPQSPIGCLSDKDMNDLYVEVESGGSFGTKPSKTVSGKLSLPLVERIESAPRLTSIIVVDMSALFHAHHLMENKLDIQSFTCGGRTMYHCRMKATSTAFSLDCHPGSYSTPATSSRSMQWKDQPFNKFEMNMSEMEFEDEEAYMTRPPTRDSQCDIDPEDPNATDTTADDYEITYYKGHNLPLVLMDYAYSQIDCPRDWADGQRGLSLPDHVWEVLDGWVDEVEKLRVVVDTGSHFAKQCKEYGWFSF